MLPKLAEHGLPPPEYRQPVVLVGGDGLGALFAAEVAAQDLPADRTERSDNLLVRVTEQACYVSVGSAQQLAERVEQLLAARPQWRGQLALQWVVNPAEHSDRAVLLAALKALRQQLARLQRGGWRLPLLLTGYLPGQHAAAQWFSQQAGQHPLKVVEAGHWRTLAHWQQLPGNGQQRGARLQALVQVSSALAWWQQTVLPPLLEADGDSPPCLALAWAVRVVPSWPQVVPGNLWQHWLARRTGLPASAAVEVRAARLPLADELMHLLPRRRGNPLSRRAWARGVWLGAVLVAAAMANSAWQNTLLARQISDDVRRYHAVPTPLSRAQSVFARKQQALAALRADAALLDRHYRHGVPPYLGLGFYSLGAMRLPLLDLVAAHRLPPLPAPPPPAAPIRLNSLSLFDVASAELKPGSERLLIKALMGIKAQPGWLIVVAGHTDATGDPARNLQLSRQRAQAVRDWMQRMGEIPDSCFAVQGHGATRPVASNTDAVGRSRNRRVDIRLVPEEGACERTPVVADSTIAQ